MKIVYFANNLVGWKILEWLLEQKAEIVALVIHPSEKQKYGSEIVRTSGLTEANIFFANTLRDEETIRKIRDLQPDIGLSVFFGYILRRSLLHIFPLGCLNIHPAYLPYNRGSYPNVWSIVEDTPSGVTLHYIDEGIDTGDIISQKLVDSLPTDTGETLYRRLEKACVELFKESWPQISRGEILRQVQVKEEGTHHRIREVAQLDKIDLDKEYTARSLINILRARTFPPYKGAYIEVDGQRIYLQLQLESENQMDE